MYITVRVGTPRRDSEYMGKRMLRLMLIAMRPRGRKKRRFKDVVKEDGNFVGVTGDPKQCTTLAKKFRLEGKIFLSTTTCFKLNWSQVLTSGTRIGARVFVCFVFLTWRNHNQPQLPVQHQYYQYCSTFNNIQYSISTEGNSQEEKNKKNLTKWPHFLCWWKLYSVWIHEQSVLAHFVERQLIWEIKE